MSVKEQTPVILKGMPCERLFIVKSGTVDILTDGPGDTGPRCDIGLYFGEEMLLPTTRGASTNRHGLALLASPSMRGMGSPLPTSPTAARQGCRYRSTVVSTSPLELFSLRFTDLEALLVSMGVFVNDDGTLAYPSPIPSPAGSPTPSPTPSPPTAGLSSPAPAATSTTAAAAVTPVSASKGTSVKRVVVDAQQLETARSSPTASVVSRTSTASLGSSGSATGASAPQYRLSDFTRIRVLGVGAFGKVFLVRHEPTGKAFALKEMLKKRLIMCKQHNNVVSERRVLQQVTQSLMLGRQRVARRVLR